MSLSTKAEAIFQQQQQQNAMGQPWWKQEAAGRLLIVIPMLFISTCLFLLSST